MKKLLILLALTAMFTCCSKNNGNQVSFDKSEFIGTWYQISTAPAGSNGIIDDQALYFLKDTYTLGADGNYIAESEIKLILQNKAEAEEKIHIDGKWELKGDSITTYLERIIQGHDTTVVNNNKEDGNTVKIIHLTTDSIVFQKNETEKHKKKMQEGKLSFGSFRVSPGTSYGVLYKIQTK